MPDIPFVTRLLVVLPALCSIAVARAEPAPSIPGYRGIWYMNQPTGDEHQYKYSGGLGTYPQQHSPIAVYSPDANKTFFCYGGATDQANELAAMVSYFDHATGQVPCPRVVLVKSTTDAHENPTIQLDDDGHLWIFSNTHGPAERSYIFRSTLPYSIDSFDQIAKTNFSYSQPWVVPGEGFLFLHTRYEGGRRLRWMTSSDGRTWSEPRSLAQVAQGHYQVSGRHGKRVATAFNYHPKQGGLNARTNLYYLETDDMGKTWRTAGGEVVETPLTEVSNAALVHDYEHEGKLVYLKDLNFDEGGRPVILYLTTGGYAPGPTSGEREWFTIRWTGSEWDQRRFTSSDHNYDYGSLHVEDGDWRVIAPTAPGPQPHGTGGSMVLWTSSDHGASWKNVKELTPDSRVSHTYARRPVDAHADFYALWADGNPLERSESSLYFTDRDGSHVWRLPAEMTGEFARPEIAW